MAKVNDAIRTGKISFGDDFNSLAEVTHLFKVSATRLPFHNIFRVPGQKDTICCLLSENGGNGWSNVRETGLRTDGKGWRDILAIRESNRNRQLISEHIEKELASPKTRLVFWREARGGVLWYKFYGVYRLDAEATKATQNGENPCCVYAKISDTADCPKTGITVQSISDDAFGGMAGAVLTCQLFDDVEYRKPQGGHDVNDPKKANRWAEFRPGMKLRVRSVSPRQHFAVCVPADANSPCPRNAGPVEFLLPKRDLELGYFVRQETGPDEKAVDAA